MNTLTEIWFLFLDSVKNRSKVESLIDKSAKTAIIRNLPISRHKHSFFLVFFIFYEQKTGITLLTLATDISGWYE